MYVIKRLPGDAGVADLTKFDPLNIAPPNSNLDTANIDKYRWDKTGYRPRAFARVGWNDAGLLVLMWAYEKSVVATKTQTGGDVCRDSCLEFFFMPGGANRYVNIECNPIPTLHIGIGAGRENRSVLQELPEDIDARSRVLDGRYWAVAYRVPERFLAERFPGFTLAPGARLKGNFYKCGDEAIEHYGMWTDTKAQKPDFHRPEAFGEMALGN